MKIIYLITKIVTYPGAYLKGFFEHLTCRALGLPVYSNRYLRSTQWCGHAEHAPASTPAAAFLLCLIPFVLQFLFGCIFLGASVGPLLIFGLRSPAETSLFWLEILCLFLGFSLVCNSFPQWSDAKRLWHLFYGSPTEEELALMEAETTENLAALERIEAEEEAANAAVDAQESESTVLTSEEAPEKSAEEPAVIITEELADESNEDDASETDAEEDDTDSESFDAILLPTSAPKFAGTFAKILFAPCNLFFMAGSFMESTGLSTILALGAIVAALIMN